MERNTSSCVCVLLFIYLSIFGLRMKMSPLKRFHSSWEPFCLCLGQNVDFFFGHIFWFLESLLNFFIFSLIASIHSISFLYSWCFAKSCSFHWQVVWACKDKSWAKDTVLCMSKQKNQFQTRTCMREMVANYPVTIVSQSYAFVYMK